MRVSVRFHMRVDAGVCVSSVAPIGIHTDTYRICLACLGKRYNRLLWQRSGVRYVPEKYTQ
eukprot:16988-Eustigmatos_ZCMA.PRE.1